MLITDKINKRLLFSCLLIFAIIVVILSFVVNPSFVSKHLSSDGFLEKPTIIKIYIIESFIFIFGFIIFLYSLIKVIKRDYAGIIKEKTIGYAKKIDEKIKPILIRFKFFKKDDPPLLQRVVLVWIIFLLIMMVSGLLDAGFLWQKAKGWEYLWIAESIESGHGFSFGRHSKEQTLKYFTTAHEEPVYPIFMALTTKAFGKHGRLAILIFQVVALFFTSVVIYHIARKVFNVPTGILAGTVLPLTPAVRYLATSYFGPAIFAGLMISISAYLIIWCLEEVSVRRGIFLGFILGLSCLLYAPILPFIPLSILFLLISMRPYSPVIGKTALSILFTAIIVVSPWTVRNLLVFGQFIPVKTGLGIIAYQSNPILASTFSSGSYACSDEFGPLWKAQNAREAIMIHSKDIKKSSAINRRSHQCIKLKAPEGYERYNEAERNSVYLKKTFDFILSEPLTFAVLSYNKILFFFSFDSLSKGVISVLFGISILLTLRNKRSWLLILFIFTYIATYLLAAPFWYRYRYPIEPILIILASYLPSLIISKFYAFLRH